MKLTVAIPTYNRPEKVKNTLSRLLPQLNEEVKVLILDNCSPVIVSEYLEKELGKEKLSKVEVIRHRVNIGADVNFQRCFELCDTSYLWMLGDDDLIEQNAVQLILKELERYSEHDLIGINFNSNCNTVQRNVPIIISGTAELVNKLDHFGNWLFISTSVYKVEEYLKYIRYQASGAYCMASQLVPPMVAISNNKVFVLSEKYIVTNIPEAPNVKWSNFQMSLSLATLIEAPVGFKKDEFRKFGKKMAFLMSIFPGDALYIILKSVNNNINLIDDYHIYIYKQLFKRTFIFRNMKGVHFIQYHQCLFLLKNKWVLKLFFKWFPKIRSESEKSVPFYLFKR